MPLAHRTVGSLATLIALFVAGCQPTVALPTWVPGPDSSLPGAEIEGTLLFEDRCFWISPSGESKDRVALLWPEGHQGALDPPRVLNASGEVAREGDLLTMGGGPVTAAAPPCATGSVWLVGEVSRLPRAP
jgi:hypothetical protein